ncbi:MAG: M20 family metallopeptidase [Candidatus Dormibacteria bacterium]
MTTLSGRLRVETQVRDEAIDTRRHLHRNPEVSFEEHRTSELITGRLRVLGLDLRPCPTPTGAVALLDTGRPGKTVLLRADIDALPIVEETELDFTSSREGLMHACGHDAHTAILLAVARLLTDRVEDLRGRFLFVFQPAEEVIGGAREMIARGLLDDVPADVAVGLHVFSMLPAGTVLTRPGLLWAGADFLDIAFTGPGGHGALMGREGNVVAAQAFLIERLNTVVEGLECEGQRCHTTIGSVNTDGTWNIVPRRARLRGSLRTFDAELRATALARLDHLLREVETEFSVESSLQVAHSTIPLRNAPGPTAVVLDAARELVGEGAVSAGAPMTVSDDMAEFLVRVPGCYFVLGAQPLNANVPVLHHSPTFDLDEACLATGIGLLALSAARLAAGV